MTQKDKCMIAYENYIRNFADKIANSKVLDIGCGTGNYTSLFSHNKNKVSGADIEDRRSNKYTKTFSFTKYDGKILPFDNGTFDIVVSFDVIEHVEDDILFTKEIGRVLRENGKILIGTPNRNRLSNVLYKLIGKPIKYPYTISEGGELGKLVHIREYTEFELTKLFNEGEIKNTKIIYFWFGLRGFIDKGIKFPLIPFLSQYLFITTNGKKL